MKGDILIVTLVSLVASAVLYGCATPEKEIVTTQADVAVTVLCERKDIDEPEQATVTLPDNASGFEKSQATMQELENTRKYANELKAALTKCSKPK